MSVFKTLGRADVARAYKALAATPNNFLMAIGSGENWWGSQQQVLLTFDGSQHAQINAQHVPVTGVTVRSADAVTLYQLTTDYTVNLATGQITRVGGGGIAPGANVQVTYTANVPQPNLTDQALVTEVGRSAVSSPLYILPFADAGDPDAPFINVEGTKYALSDDPTRMLLFQANVNSADGVGDPIREYALFSRCEVDPDLPPGQTWFEPGDIVTSGVLVISKRRTPVPHDGTIGIALSVIVEI